MPRPVLAVVLMVWSAAAPAAADTAALAAGCAVCHGPGLEGSGTVPALAGLDAPTLAARLGALRDGSAPSTIMGRLARGLTEDEIAALAAWIGQGDGQ